MKLINTKLNGVYYRESLNKKYNGKPDRCFYIKYYINKKQKQECIGWASEGFSAQYAAGIRNERLSSPKQKQENYTFDQLYDNFMIWAKSNKKTWKCDENLYNNHVKEYLEKISVNSITPQDITNILLKMKAKGKANGSNYAPQSIKHILLLIKRIFNYNIKNELIKYNPAENVKIEKFDNTRISYLYDDEIARMFEYLDSSKEWPNDKALIKFAFFTGLRKSELFNLIWDNVDIENKRIFLYDTKGGKNQTIIITDNAVQVLLDIKDKCSDSTLVFPSKLGGKRNDVKRLWTRIKKAANIRPDIRFHDIRHTFGTLATATIPVKVVQKMMTHKDIKTTLRYAHIQEKEMIDAANNLGQMFSSINKTSSGATTSTDTK